MNKVDYIEINIINIGNNKSIIVDIKNNLVLINEHKKNITNEKIEDLFRIIRKWDKEYPHSNIIDEEKFIIKIINKDNVDIIKSNGAHPNNYYEFKRWIGDVND